MILTTRRNARVAHGAFYHVFHGVTANVGWGAAGACWVVGAVSCSLPEPFETGNPAATWDASQAPSENTESGAEGSSARDERTDVRTTEVTAEGDETTESDENLTSVVKVEADGAVVDGAVEDGAVEEGGRAVETPAPGDGGTVAPSPPIELDGGFDPVDVSVVDYRLEELVLYLDMEASVPWGAGNQVEDKSRRGNHGVAHGDAAQVTSGRYGAGAAFDGFGWLEVNNNDSLRGDAELTLAAWIRSEGYESDADSYGIISKRVAYDDKTSYALWLDYSGRLALDIVLSESRVHAPDPVPAQKWTHVAAVYKGALARDRRLRMYVDGVLVAVGGERSSSIPSEFDANVRIGDLPLGGLPFRGVIDEVGIWTGALSDATIKHLAAAETPLAERLAGEGEATPHAGE